MQVSASVDILPGHRGTYIRGVCTFGALQRTAIFCKKWRGTYFRRGTYLRGFTVSSLHPRVLSWKLWVTVYLPFIPVCCHELAPQVKRSFGNRATLRLIASSLQTALCREEFKDEKRSTYIGPFAEDCWMIKVVLHKILPDFLRFFGINKHTQSLDGQQYSFRFAVLSKSPFRVDKYFVGHTDIQ